ncbi:MAG: alkaline phosphatase [Oscillospiraceae bacterium]|nr:alkaline phosphatase [Oscillospiraceae bacterium]
MRKLSKILSLALAVMMAAGAQGASLAEDASPSIRIFPVDRATILAGAVVDFKVEVNYSGGTADDVAVTLDGVPAVDVFGAATSEGITPEDGTYAMWEGVTFTRPGAVEVSVSANVNGITTEKTVAYTVLEAGEKKARNVILMIGDGLAQPTRTAARIMSKNLTEGRFNGYLNMDVMDVATLVTTSGIAALVTDSANSASAYATGHKTANNAMGVYTYNPNVDDQVGAKVENIIELAKRAGMSTGIVSTSEITDATPSAMFTHILKRSNMQAIADQMFLEGQRPDVILGGGAWWFWPSTTTGSKRADERDLIADFEGEGYAFVGSATELAAVDTASASRLLGLFNSGNMSPYVDKFIEKSPDILKGFDDQPSLMAMTKAAIDVLSQNEEGFFLMVEGALIDKQEHAMDWERAVVDTIEFDQAVGIAKDFADINDDTLVIVVADHSHSISVYGTIDTSKPGLEGLGVYENAKFPTYADEDGDGFPDVISPDITLAIGWGNHPSYYEDFRYHAVPSAPAVIVDDVAVANANGRAEDALLIAGNLTPEQPQEVHSADDVTLTAYGAGSSYFNKTLTDNTEVFFAMVNALGLNPLEFGK